MTSLVALLLACGGGAALDVPHPPPEWPVAARPVAPAPAAPSSPDATVAPIVPVEAPPSDVQSPDTDATR